ncbi:hypothetical protein C0992_004363 [Termitomyces sp. T32_za158]|nr:hypothetical protein C0992_004363 [Termitomyces sp. T32_za158]
MLPGVAHLLTQNDSDVSADNYNNTTNLASAILSRAGTHRAHASDTRLHAGPPCTIQTTSSSNKFNNLSKARQINLERQQKKYEAKLCKENKGITIIAVLWRYDENHFERTRPISDMFEEFQTQKLTTDSNIKASTIKIRVAINASESIADFASSAAYSTSLASSRKKSLKCGRADTTSLVPASGSKKLSVSRSVDSELSSSSTKIVLKSAFKPRNPAMPPPRWTRNPPMQKYTFTRSTAVVLDDGEVDLTTSEKKESIEIATDWRQGEAASKQKKTYNTTGYIGCGATKRAIYARFNGQEYVLTQNSDDQTTPDEVKKNLTGEYELLALCHWFKAKFDEHSTAQGLKTIPRFYFNYSNSILGTLDRLASGSIHVPFRDFIATPLLPCGPIDPEVRKFMGNDIFGEASDDMTRAIHAFVHFSVAYSQDHFLFCDLQGTIDSDGIMCLFDPQAHT